MLQGFGTVFGRLFRFIGTNKLLPKSFVGIFIIYFLIKDVINLGWIEALKNLGLRIFSAEYIINQNVTLALNNPEMFKFIHLIEIINSFFIAYFVIRFIGKHIFIGMTGSQAPSMAYFMAIIIYFVIELPVVMILGQYDRIEKYIPLFNETVLVPQLNFIPIKDGLFYLFMNIESVLGAVDWFWLKRLGIRSYEVINQTIINETQNITKTL